MIKLLYLLTMLVFAPLATAQTPAPFPIGECTTVNVEEDPGDPEGFDFQREEYRIPGEIIVLPGNFCSEYAYFGWEETMQLYLGEGADEYRELIELAVKVWNETVNLPSREPLIEIVETWPTNYWLPESFAWSMDHRYEVGRNYRDDGESVIYFAPFEEEATSWGAAWRRSRSGNMVQTDIYINTEDEESVPEETLVLTKKLVDVDSSYGAYAIYNKTYEVILHEIGHAVGLRHIPVNGNVMSKDFGAGGIDQWAATVAFDLFNHSSPRRHKFVYRNSEIYPYMSVDNEYSEMLKKSEFFTNNAKLGEQEKMTLTCIYEY